MRAGTHRKERADRRARVSIPMTATRYAARDTACLVVFLKAPDRSKRRLAAQIGEAATTAASHLLACTLEDASAWPGHVVLAPAAAADADWLSQQVHLDYEVVLQRGESLGARINHVDRALRGRGLERLIFVGADCPTLDGRYLRAADRALADADAVLGPAVDGGVVLMGARRPWPDIDTLAWSTPALRGDLVARLRDERWSIATLHTLADVDESADLATLAAALADDPRPARRDLAAWLGARDRREDPFI
jgi:glycosyltransferase A (GT-A) superfamily protein (DUF2064 family)